METSRISARKNQLDSIFHRAPRHQLNIGYEVAITYFVLTFLNIVQ